ncbi:MAG: hypothetical protein H3Z53_04355 [archaeon]|nr:hypothetical protein [archaeon]MCP8313588.1 hypothetical protein [archaeon]MCP8315984.1 hypothetical protein [archaeon]MCP8319848.1 hypothetical protein [archaeon]
MQASLELKMFNTPDELKKFLDDEIGRIRTLLGDYLRRLEENRIKTEKLKKAQEAIIKFAGEKQIPSLEGREIDLSGFKVFVNPSLRQEMDVLEDIVKSLQDKLNTIQKIRKALEPLTGFEEGIVTIVAIISDNVPIKLMIHLKP